MYTKIKTFKDACKALGIDPATLPDVSMLPKNQQAAVTASYKLFIIAEALNEGWKPNWKDSSEWKYYPWFDMRNGFSYFGCGNHYSCSFVGSRLCYKNSDIAKYAGTQFIKLYKDVYVIK